MRSQDSTAKDAPMDKSGMVQAALTTLPVPLDSPGTLTTIDVIPKPSIAAKTQNGTEPCVSATPDSTKLTETSALSVQPTLPGTERPVTLKFQSIHAEATKFSSVESAFAKTDSSTLKELALNVPQEPLGTENTATVPQHLTGVWVNQIPSPPTEAVHVLPTTLSSMDAAFEFDFIASCEDLFIFNHFFFFDETFY
jgi:hypothetical protein